MDLTELTKGAKTMQEVMKKVHEQNLRLGVYEVQQGFELEIISPQKDYALVKESPSPGMMGTSTMFIHPYGGSVGYRLA